MLFPAVAGLFLWPLGGQGHPLNKPTPHCPTGPYGAQLGDSYLNRKIKQGADVDSAVAEYAALDAAQLTDLDRFLEVAMAQQRQRDEVTGFSFAPYIEANFRDKRLFLSPNHPGLDLAKRWIIEILRRYLADAATIERIERNLVRTPFPEYETPIHPAVIRHYRLSFLPENPTYQYGYEGNFTFEEYCRRYMTFEWNDELDDGLALVRSGQTDRAIRKLQRALARSPSSMVGYTALASMLSNAGRQDEALVAARHAASLDGTDAISHSRLATIFAQAGLVADAEHEFRRAIECDPTNGTVRTSFSRFLLRQDRSREAADVARSAAQLDPYNGLIRSFLAGVLLKLKQVDEAEAEIHAGLRMAPDSPALLRGLSDVLVARDKLAEAETAARRAVELAPGNAGTLSNLGSVLVRLGRYDEAEAEFRAALEIAPANVPLLGRLGHLLGRQNRIDEAIEVLRLAAQTDPDNSGVRGRLNGLLDRAARRGRPSRPAMPVEAAAPVPT